MFTSSYYNEALKVQFMYVKFNWFLSHHQPNSLLAYFLNKGVICCYSIQSAINVLAVLQVDRPERRKQDSITKALC